MLYYIMSYYIILYYIMSYYIILYYIILYYINWIYVNYLFQCNPSLLLWLFGSKKKKKTQCWNFSYWTEFTNIILT